MQLITKTLPRDHNLFLFGDTHLGSRLCHLSGIEQLIDAMRSPAYDLPASANFGIHHSDAIEGILIDDPRYNPSTCPQPFALQQVDDFVELMQPIKNKIIVMLYGNHEIKLWKFGNLSAEISKRLGISYGTFSCRLTYLDPYGQLMYKHFATHGHKPINSTAEPHFRRESNMKLILKRHLEPFGGDCALNSKGHTHRLLIMRPYEELYLSDDQEKVHQHYTRLDQTSSYIHPDARWYVNTGAFYKLYELGVSSYAEEAEYPPIQLGYAVVKVRDGIIRDIEKVYV